MRGLANRIALTGGGLSAKSYVQEGLIAMWDGIENIGYGKHSDTAREWVDLTGNHKLSYEFDPTFQGNAFLIPGNAKIAYCTSDLMKNAVTNNSVTVEIVFNSPNIGYNSNSLLSLNYGFKSTSRRDWWLWANSILAWKLTASQTVIWRDTVSKNTDTSIAFVNTNYYKNGALYDGSVTPISGECLSNVLQIGMIGNFADTAEGYASLRALIYAIRIYNSALKPKEIAANYAVDCARFNLTANGGGYKLICLRNVYTPSCARSARFRASPSRHLWKEAA